LAKINKTKIMQIAPKHPKNITVHTHTRIDNYYWLNDRENPETITYLEAENAYTEKVLAPTENLQKQLFEEMKGRIKEDDFSVPYQWGKFWYYSRYEIGTEYPIYCRIAEKPVNLGDISTFKDEKVILNVNELAKGHEYFTVGQTAVSPNDNLLAYSVDTVSRRIYTIYIKNLLTGELLADQLPETSGAMLWADDQTLIYVKKDVDTLRDYQVFRHKIGTPSTQDILLFEETDETFYLDLSISKSKQYIFINSQSTTTDEVLFINLCATDAPVEVLQPRQKDHKYSADHVGMHFYIRTNDEAENYKIVTTPITKPQKEYWKTIIPHKEDSFIESFEVISKFLIVEERKTGLIELHCLNLGTQESHYLQFDEPVYLAYLGTNTTLETTSFRFGYTSLTTPTSTIEYDVLTQQKTVLKTQTVVGNFDKTQYKTERLWATATDGTKIPISIVYHKNTPLNGTAPLLQYGYGSYGITIDATFSAARLSLLDRGFIYAIAHIRGGQELGYQWYENGKLLQKMNTFTDFIAVSEFLIAEKYTSKEKLFAYGGSAGGLLIGAVINLRPDLYKGVMAAVPFVDCVTTMLDDTIPLTTFEYDEWGNPNDQTYYEYMLSYSPYDNVKAQDYPNILITTGLHDSQVQYWEPAKWTAKLRELKTDKNLLLLHTDMTTGHGGSSGRFQRLKEYARDYAFLLWLANFKMES
jgi:oligopeptidase B